MIIASQGHDLNGGDSTLPHDPGGTIKAEGNFMDAFSCSPERFDPAVDASPGPAVSGGAIYNDFDAKFGSDYPQLLDSPKQGKTKVLVYAGRIKPSPANVVP